MQKTGGAAAANLGTGWKAVGTSDFNGDGRSDIVMQSSDGHVQIWAMNGNTLLGTTALTNTVPGWYAATGVG